jgi:hypothetical protein
VLLPNTPFRELLGTPAEMFRFFRGDPDRTHRIMDRGVFPWWTDPILKAEFLQALTVFTHRLDYVLWPDSPALMHAQSLIWLGTSLAAVAVFYRREIRPKRGYIDWVLDRVFRGERRPMALGEEVRLTGMTARVTAKTDDGRPAVMTFRFDVPLESDSLVWLCFRGQGFERFSLPGVGQETEIRFDFRAMLYP